MYEGSCHCGNVHLKVDATPDWLTSCNCSICRRLGALWGHVPITSVTVVKGDAGTESYIHGDRMLAFHSCRTCGCTTHWESLNPDEHPDMGVNFRMSEPEVVAGFRIRQFDGADSWTFLD